MCAYSVLLVSLPCAYEGIRFGGMSLGIRKRADRQDAKAMSRQ
jgi:hypothetical protein